MVTFVMLSPSTADATHDDPTVKKCTKYARRWGFIFMDVVNLSPLRATNSADLIGAGPEPTDVWETNPAWVRASAEEADTVVLAYGVKG